MIRRVMVVLGVGVTPFVLAVNGCAALVGFDESYELPTDAALEAARDAGDASVTDAAPLTDATGDTTVSSTDAFSMSDASPTVDAVAPIAWQLDDGFGQGGVQVLGTFAAPTTPALPVINVDLQGGVVRVAYSDDSQVLFTCASPFDAGSCSGLGANGTPVDLLSTGGNTVLVANSGTSVFDQRPLYVLPVAGSPGSYAQSGSCFGGRALSFAADGTVSVAAYCNANIVVLNFVPSGGVSFSTPLPEVAGVNLFSATSGGAGDVWFVGCEECGPGATSPSEALYLHEDVDAATTLAGGSAEDGGFLTFASDVLLFDGGALLAGGFTGTESGLLTARVPATVDGGAVFTPHLFELAGGSVAIEPAGHTRIVNPRADVNVMVGTTSSGAPHLVLVTVDDQGLGLSATPGQPQVLTPPFAIAVSSLVLGGAVAFDGGVYVAVGASSSFSNTYLIGVVRLVEKP